MTRGRPFLFPVKCEMAIFFLVNRGFHSQRRKARLIEQLGTIYIFNISEGTAFLLQGVTKNDSKS